MTNENTMPPVTYEDFFRLQKSAKRVLGMLKDIHAIVAHYAMPAMEGIDLLARDSIACLDDALYWTSDEIRAAHNAVRKETDE